MRSSKHTERVCQLGCLSPVKTGGAWALWRPILELLATKGDERPLFVGNQRGKRAQRGEDTMLANTQSGTD